MGIRWIGVLLMTSMLLLGCVSEQRRSNQRSRNEVDWAPYHQQVLDIEAVASQLLEVRRRLQADGINPDAADELDAIVSTASVNRRIGRYNELKVTLRGELLNLWLLTGYADPITKRPFSNVADHWRDIVREYSRYLADQPRLAEEALGRTALPTTVAAVASPHGTIAYVVLQKWVYLEPMYFSTADVALYEPMSERDQRSLGPIIAHWFEAHRGRFEWDPQRRQFTDQRDLSFTLPRVEEIQAALRGSRE